MNISNIPIGTNLNSISRYIPPSENRPESLIRDNNQNAVIGRADSAAAKQSAPNYNNFGNTDIQSEPVLYEPLSIRLGTYGGEDGVFAIHDIYAKAKEYAAQNNMDIHSYSMSNDGIIITESSAVPTLLGFYNGKAVLSANEGKQHLITWAELGFNNPLNQNNDDRYFINHHIFGEIEFANSTYGNADFNEILEVSDKYRLMTEQWYSVNGAPPDTFSIGTHPNNINKDLFTIKEYIGTALFNGYGMNIRNTITSTDTVIKSFIEDFNRVTAVRQDMLEELELYYSIDEIIKRAEKAGFGNDAQLLETIIEAQYKYGQEVIEAQRINQGYFNTDKGLEQSLADYLRDKWDFNDVFKLFGFENTPENKTALAESVAKAALTGSSIQIGGYTLSYSQFLSIEKTMANVYSGLSAKFTSGSSVSLDSLQTMVKHEGLKHADKRIGDLLDNWFNSMTSVYHHIWDLKLANLGNAIWNIIPWQGQDIII